jgi:D-amino-acid dehydrogenase
LGELHVAVIGAGIIGLAVAYHLEQGGARVMIIDRDPHGDKASFGNAGGIAVTEVIPAAVPGVWWRSIGWMLDPLGPLAIRPARIPNLIPWLAHFAMSGRPQEVDRISRAIAVLNSRVYEDLLPMLESAGLAGELLRNGALSLYETEAGYRKGSADRECMRSRGVIFEELTGMEARKIEPALGPLVQRAIFLPQWSHIKDPIRLMKGLSNWLWSRGVVFRQGKVQRILVDSNNVPQLQLENGEKAPVDKVVLAAGVWSKELAYQLGDKVLLESERGYNATLPKCGIVLRRQLIFAQRKFVATPLSCGLRIGGAAEFGGLHAPANFKRSQALVELAKRYLPDLQTDGSANWTGHRPATPDSLPVIGMSRRYANVLYAFGHGHLGLTQAATTGRLIAELALNKRRSIDLTPYSIRRFC